MVESILQTFLLLAYFDIALISITIANYAISASYLGREYRLSRWRMDKRKQKLLEKLKELKQATQIEGIKKEIAEEEKEERGIGQRVFLLSWLGAVVAPSIFFIISFTNAIIGMNSEILSKDVGVQGFLEQQFMILSSGFIVLGFIILLAVIGVIDSAARKLPIPEFEVTFPKGMKVLKLKRNERKTIELCVTNKGEDIAENLQIFVIFHPSFKVNLTPFYSVTKQIAQADYPEHNAAIFDVGIIHIDTTLQLHVDLTSPDIKETYEIPIDIYERKTGKSKHKLTIEVID
jgi:hypothetical protein